MNLISIYNFYFIRYVMSFIYRNIEEQLLISFVNTT